MLADLVRCLLDAGRAKVQKDFDELVVEPFSEPDPKPLQGLVPPAQLADAERRVAALQAELEQLRQQPAQARSPLSSMPA